MTILQLVYRLNAISIERNKIEMATLKGSTPDLEMALNKLDEEHDAIIRELCGRIPSLENDKNLQPKKKVRK